MFLIYYFIAVFENVLSARYVESFFIPLTSIEQDLQTNLISINYSQAELIKIQNAATSRYAM